MASDGNTYRFLFAIREYRYLYFSQTLSFIGDQLGAVAVAVLVFNRTGSGFLSAVAYASAWLPGIFGGPVLSFLADRFPRRTVLVVCDLARALLVLVFVLPTVSIGVSLVVLYVAHLFTPVFSSARSALMPDVLPGDSYVLGNGLGNITGQICQLIGLPLGGLVVAVAGPVPALLANSVTYVVSAALIVLGVQRRPLVIDSKSSPGFWRETVDGLRYVTADPWLRNCLLLVWIASAFCFAPEGIAYLFALELGGGPTTAGILLAAPSVGFVAGTYFLTRMVTGQRRERLLSWAALLSTAALMPLLWAADLPLVLGLLCLSGVGAAFSAPLNAVFVRRVDPVYRGRAMGVAISGLLAAQGLGFLAAGWAVQAGASPSATAGASGVLGTLAVLGIIVHWLGSPARSMRLEV